MRRNVYIEPPMVILAVTVKERPLTTHNCQQGLLHENFPLVYKDVSEKLPHSVKVRRFHGKLPCIDKRLGVVRTNRRVKRIP